MSGCLAGAPTPLLHMIHHLVVLLLLVLLILQDEATDADMRARLGEYLLLRGPLLLLLELKLLSLSKCCVEDLLSELEGLIVRRHGGLRFTLLLHLNHVNMVKLVDQVVELGLCLLQLLDIDAELTQFLIKDLCCFSFNLSLL